MTDVRYLNQPGFLASISAPNRRIYSFVKNFIVAFSAIHDPSGRYFKIIGLEPPSAVSTLKWQNLVSTGVTIRHIDKLYNQITISKLTTGLDL